MPNKKVRKMRGPSRPIDPRYAPGAAPRRGLDTFGMALIGTSVVFVLLIIVWAAAANGNNNTTTSSTTSSDNSATAQVTQSVDQSALATQQVLAVAPTMTEDAIETANLPRIEPADAIAQLNAGDVTIVDVRAPDTYLKGHVKGATNIPESEVKTNLSKFPKLGNLIVYCQ